MLKLIIIFWVLTLIARVAGESHTPLILYFGIGLAYYWLVLRFPLYTIQKNEQDIEE